MKRLLILAVLILVGVSFNAYAQNPVVTNPSSRTSVNTASTTIAVTNTFQSVFVSNVNRKGCVIQNKSSDDMYVFFGAIADASQARAGLVKANNSVYCTAFGTVLTDQVSITGTSGDSFYASQY